MVRTAVKRLNGIPGSNAKQIIVDMNGPIQRRRSLTSEQHPQQQRPSQPTSNTNGSEAINLLSTKADDSIEQEEDCGTNIEQDYDHEDEEEQQQSKEEQPSMQTRDIPQEDYQNEDETYHYHPRASYVTTHHTHQYSSTPAAKSNTREMRSRQHPTTGHPVTPAGKLNKTRTNYRPEPRALPRRQHHPLLWIGLTLIAVTLIFIFVIPWITDRYNDVKYRTPRIDYTYATLGSNDDSAHQSFITSINKGGQVIVTLYPGNNKAPVAFELEAPTSDGAAKAPATIEIIPGKTASTKYIAIHYNGSIIVLSYENNTLKRVM